MPGQSRPPGAPGTGPGSGRTYTATARRRGSPGNDRNIRGRFAIGRIVLVVLLVAAGVKLVQIQGFQAEALSEKAEQQRTTTIDIPAQRGSIVDRSGNELAFSVETRTLWANLRLMRKTWRDPKLDQNYDQHVTEIAKFIAKKLPNKTNEQDLLEEFRDKDTDFTYLVDGVEPSVADEIKQAYPEIGYEKRAERDYPGGELASNLVGYANWRMDDPDVSKHNIHGLAGLESMYDSVLAGTPGRQIVDTAQGNDNVVIPGTEREMQAAVAGSDLELTIDSDLQFELQRALSDYVRNAHAKGGSAVVLDSKTGEVYGLANDKTFDADEPDSITPELLNNTAVTTPYEPGSVNKVVTAAAGIDAGVIKPSTVLQVPGSIQVADATIHDAWSHGTQPFTATGVFAKSSNVGTLKIAQRVGPDKWLDTAKKLGIGTRTGIGLPGESPGSVPPRSQWSGSTFGNLPIGQGLSMTVVQMAGMYQAIANDGVRVEPRIVRAKVQPGGKRVPEPAPKRTRVVSEKTADTVKDMLRATTQGGDVYHDGTAPEAALEGYQIAGKTGTAQRINPATGAYSHDLYNITFSGILPADDPRFVVGIWLDRPDTTLPQGSSAAPLFHEISSYLAQRFQIPLSKTKAPVKRLIM